MGWFPVVILLWTKPKSNSKNWWWNTLLFLLSLGNYSRIIITMFFCRIFRWKSYLWIILTLNSSFQPLIYVFNLMIEIIWGIKLSIYPLSCVVQNFQFVLETREFVYVGKSTTTERKCWKTLENIFIRTVVNQQLWVQII